VGSLPYPMAVLVQRALHEGFDIKVKHSCAEMLVIPPLSFWIRRGG
jgi:hypothetical protein